MDIESVILDNLIHNEQYARKTIPFVKADYFADPNYSTLFKIVESFVGKYNAFPTKEALYIELNNTDGLSEQQFKDCTDIIKAIDKPDDLTQTEFLVDQTEKFCQDRAVYNAIRESIKILDDKTGKLLKGTIPQILSDALAVSFDTNIGHDFLEDAQKRFDFYHNVDERVPFDLEMFNHITNGGLPKKTLNVFLGGAHTGKTLFMCHMAAANLAAGKNVLYITMEMSEEKIAERIDANLLDARLDDLADLPLDVYMKRVQRVRDNTVGKLIIKEYPTSGAGSSQFKHLLNELTLKKNFQPDIIYIDYLNICASSKVKQGPGVNSYTYIKNVAEELRALAIEYNLPIVTSTQTTRDGIYSSDLDMTNTSESISLAQIADSLFAIIATDELKALNQYLIKQLKNRFGDIGTNTRFVIGVDRPKMRLYNAETSAQEDIMDGPVFDNTPSSQKPNADLFKDFK